MDECNRVFIVDDDADFTSSVTWTLKNQNLDLENFPSAEAFLGRYDGGPGCALLDVRLTGMSGPELQREINRREWPLTIVIITGHGDVPIAVQAMKDGAFEFLQKPFPREQLLSTIDRALRCNADLMERRNRCRTFRENLSTLTPREREVIELVVSGETTKRIAQRLAASPRTIDVHRARIMKKMGVSSPVELVAMAFKHGLAETVS